jgi:hypothetical protein
LVQREQRLLEQDVREATALLATETRRLSARIAIMPPDIAKAETEALAKAQDALKRLMRRYAAALKRSEELERELALWQARRDEAGERHADHPATRAEVIRSELAVRGIVPAEPPALVPLSALGSGVGVGEGTEASSAALSSELEEIVYAPHPDTVHLIQAIREATREAERWHGYHSDDPLSYAEAVDQLRHVRSLHAALKILDRRAGVDRDRLTFAVRMREV